MKTMSHNKSPILGKIKKSLPEILRLSERPWAAPAAVCAVSSAAGGIIVQTLQTPALAVVTLAASAVGLARVGASSLAKHGGDSLDDAPPLEAADLSDVIFRVEQAILFGITGRMSKRCRKSLANLLTDAKQKDPEALWEFSGHFSADGDLPTDSALEADLCRLAAEGKHPKALFKLGQMYEWGRGIIPQDGKKAAECYRLAAEQGHPDAMVALGRMLCMGSLIRQNIPEGELWLRRGAACKNVLARYMLWRMYTDGICAWQDWAEASEWRRDLMNKRSGETQSKLPFDASSHSPAQAKAAEPAPLDEKRQMVAATALEKEKTRLLATPMENLIKAWKDTPETKRWFKKIAVALRPLGLTATMGGKIVERADESGANPAGNPIQRFWQLRQAVNPKREMTAGADVPREEGIPKIVAKTLAAIAENILPTEEELQPELAAITEEVNDWLRESAEQGHAESQFQFSSRVKTEAEMVKWEELAAAQGHPLAQFHFGLNHLPMVQQGGMGDSEKSHASLLASAEGGSAEAQLMLVVSYTRDEFPHVLNHWQEELTWHVVIELLGGDDEDLRMFKTFCRAKLSKPSEITAAEKKAHALHKKILLRLEKWKEEYRRLWGPCAALEEWWSVSSVEWWPPRGNDDAKNDVNGGASDAEMAA